MKKILKMISNLKVLIILSIAFLIQCNTEKKEIKPKIENEISSNTFKNMLLKDYNDIIEIISLKYNLDTIVTHNIVNLYFIETDVFYRVMQAKKSNNQINIKDIYNKKFPITAFSDTIVNRFDHIDKEKLGKILFDIELLKQLKEINDKIE